MNSIFPHAAAAVSDGVPCFHPDVAGAAEDFPVESFEHLARVEGGHFWFEARNTILRHLVGKHLEGRGAECRFLEIGCGTGFVLRMIAGLPGVRAAGAEVHLAGAKLAAQRLSGVEVVQLDALRMNFRSAFDAIGLFDVIEHLQEDRRALERVAEALVPGGLCFLSVPQHAWLWSPQDDLAGHKRRYTRASLREVVAGAGLEPVWSTSFCFSVMPLLMLSRFGKRTLDLDEARRRMLSEVELPAWQNSLLRALLRIDEVFIRRGISLPCGGSLILVARKPGD